MGTNYLADIPGNQFVHSLGSTAAVASNGANAVVDGSYCVAPQPVKVLSVFKVATANEVTAGTAVSSASYRRFQLCNGGSAGTATTIMASLNNTASTAAGGSKGFVTTANNTATTGDILYVSHLTVGAATANGTDAAAGPLLMVVQLL